MTAAEDEAARRLGAELAQKLIEWVEDLPGDQIPRAAVDAPTLQEARNLVLAGALLELHEHLERKPAVDLSHAAVQEHLTGLLRHGRVVTTMLPDQPGVGHTLRGHIAAALSTLEALGLLTEAEAQEWSARATTELDPPPQG